MYLHLRENDREYYDNLILNDDNFKDYINIYKINKFNKI